MSAIPYAPHAARQRLPDTGLRGRFGPYFASEELVAAANAAIALDMPLLLTGEPGCGKTDFAFALASHFHPGTPPFRCYIRSDSGAGDLLYHYDAVRRFGDAQHGGPSGLVRASDPRNYVELRGLGRAMLTPPPRPEGRWVVLIDEIDKAPRDLPNDLLRELEEWDFEIPEIVEEGLQGEVLSHGIPLHRHLRARDGQRPLVLITSNVERQLPDAFLRRCVFFHIPFPTTDRLHQILRARFPDADLELHRKLVPVFEALRKEELTKPPSTSELLDWARLLDTLYEREAVLDALSEAKAALERKQRVAWTGLPGLHCLAKLRTDREILGQA